MTPDRWRIICELLDSALRLPPGQRDAFLLESTKQDPTLYSEVGVMLEAHSEPGPFDHSPLSVMPSAFEAASARVPVEPSFHPGDILGARYRIVRFLNRGGMGEVYEAQDLEFAESVALKTLLPAIAGNARMIARFKQEIQLSRKIGHFNVCRVFDLARHPAAGDASGPVTYFLTMELLGGETLAASLQRDGAMPLDAAFPLLRQMADALDAAHATGVIHRDFKPSNVMLVPAATGVRAVVTDFGLARSFTPTNETAPHTTEIIGTFDYMAPELLKGRSATVASDVYAFGCVVRDMVKLQDGTPASAAVSCALSADPTLRPPSAGRLIQSLTGDSSTSPWLSWFLSRRVLLIGGAAASGLASFSLVSRFQGQGPLLSSTSPDPLVMLTPFTNSTEPAGAAGRGLAVSLLIEKQLGQSGRIRILPRDRVIASWKRNPQHSGDLPVPIPPAAAREIAIRERAGCLLFGSFSQVAEEWTLRVRLELLGESPDYPRKVRSRDFREQDAASAAFEAVNWVRRMLSESDVDLQTRSRRPEELTTSNWHALQEYALGDDAWRSNQRPSALEHLREALRIDPEFALAAARFADLATATGRIDEGIQYYERAERLLVSRNLTDRESLRIRGVFALDTGRFEEADHVFALWSESYPEDALPLYYRSTALDRLNRSPEATPLLERAIQREPQSFSFAYRRAHRALQLGSIAEAKIRCDQIAAMSRTDWTDQLRSSIAFAEMRFDDVWVHLEHMRATGSVSFQSRALVLQACFRAEQGRHADAIHLLEEALQFDRTNGLSQENQFAKMRRIAQISLLLSDRSAAIRQCRTILQGGPGLESALQTAAILASAGDTSGAASLLPASPPVWPVQRHWFLRAHSMLALVRGDAHRALELMRGAPPSRPEAEWPAYLALAAERAGDEGTVTRLLNTLFENPARYWHLAEGSAAGFFRTALQIAETRHFAPSSPDVGRTLEFINRYFLRRN